jgi:hypothetical protein
MVDGQLTRMTKLNCSKGVVFELVNYSMNF